MNNDLNSLVSNESDEQKVTPFEVEKISNYNKVITQFGCTPFSNDGNDPLFERFEKLTGVKMPSCYRHFLISHREFGEILNAYEKEKPIYLYTGRGPSSENMHLGHMIPFKFCKFLQDALNAPLVIQITDDEKYIFKDLTMDKIAKMAKENIKDIIACGFNVNKTFVFLNSQSMGMMYPMIIKIQKLVTLKDVLNTFGFPLDGKDTTLGKVAFPPVQAAPAFAETFIKHFLTKNGQFTEKDVRKIKCLVPCAIDQDPYFRMCRGISNQLEHSKPALIHFSFLPSLNGVDTKMSSSTPQSCIFLTDTVSQIRKKINKCFSGGKELLEEHKLLGGNTNNDVSFQLLKFFMDNDEKLKELEYGFNKGEITCSQMKGIAIEKITEHIERFKENRAKVDEDIYSQFTDVNKTLFFCYFFVL